MKVLVKGTALIEPGGGLRSCKVGRAFAGTEIVRRMELLIHKRRQEAYRFIRVELVHIRFST